MFSAPKMAPPKTLRISRDKKNEKNGLESDNEVEKKAAAMKNV